MHTFFINTSGNEIENYSDILEIQHETRKLVSLNCPLEKWQQEEEGYKACVSHMGEQIDSYKDINNDFNLIVYVDLISVKEYAEISMRDHRVRFACLEALYALFKQYIYTTIVAELQDCGRSPHEVLIIFEENQKPADGDTTTDDGKGLFHLYMQKFMGFTDAEALSSFADMVIKKGQDADFSALLSELQNLLTAAVFPGLAESYADRIDIFLREIQENNGYETPMLNLFDHAKKISDSNDEIKSVYFITNRRAGVANKQERIRRDLRLSFYIFDCVDSESIFNVTIHPETEEKTLHIKPFPELDWEKVTKEILKRNCLYKKQYNETVSLSESFSAMGLAPELYALDFKRFSLDCFGKRAKAMAVVDAMPKPISDEINGESIGSTEEKKLEISEKVVECLLSETELIPSSLTEVSYKSDFYPERASAETFISEAKKERESHIQHLKNLKIHIMDVLSNYAGRSLENEPALLAKRKVSLAEGQPDDMGVIPRCVAASETKESKKIDAVSEISDTAYESVVLDYLEFCAGRSVSVTDIEEQCNQFITQVYQISESLKKLKIVFRGLLALLLVLYLPFVAIQWETITSGLLNGFIAVSSVVVPALILSLVFAILSRVQRKKYVIAWEVFKEKSDQAKRENCLAAKKYSQLLSSFIPALRWVYEYKLEVEFYADCCKLAKAKINHHIQKLQNRITTMKNIIDDLEIDEKVIAQCGDTKQQNDLLKAIDYHVSYCTDKKNQEFYSLINRNFIESIQK